MELPDFSESVDYIDDVVGCEIICLKNCSCVAYAYVTGIGCMVWTGDLIEIQEFIYEEEDLFFRLSNSELGEDKHKMELIFSFAAVSSFIILGVFTYGLCRLRAIQRGKRAAILQGIII